jgi:hypothetical protein
MEIWRSFSGLFVVQNDLRGSHYKVQNVGERGSSISNAINDQLIAIILCRGNGLKKALDSA